MCLFCRKDTTKVSLWTGVMPLKMSIYDNPSQSFSLFEMKVVACPQCGCIQISHLPPQAELYSNNYNTDIVGITWEKHYQEFIAFVQSQINFSGIKVLEIGDPSAKIANRCRNLNIASWTIVEPDPHIQTDNWLKIEKCLFEEYESTEKFDLIVHSHVLEHQYDPMWFMYKCRTLLKPGGKMIFSIPNMEGMARSSNYLANILSFEHPYYITQDILRQMCVGFAKSSVIEYNNPDKHSLFVSLTKVNDAFDDLLDRQHQALSNLKSALSQYDQPFYIMSAHIKSQQILADLDIRKHVIGILDNAPSKQGGYLSGCNLPIEALTPENTSRVIVSHMGPYREEISKQILTMNPGAILL